MESGGRRAKGVEWIVDSAYYKSILRFVKMMVFARCPQTFTVIQVARYPLYTIH